MNYNVFSAVCVYTLHMLDIIFVAWWTREAETESLRENGDNLLNFCQYATASRGLANGRNKKIKSFSVFYPNSS